MDVIKKTVKLLLAAGVIATLVAPVSATAAQRNECGGKWEAGAVCNFRYAGGAISVKASFVAPEAGYVSLLLEAVDPESGQRIPVLSCGTALMSRGACSTVTSDSPVAELERGQKLVCTVQGADRGKYSCASYR